MKIWTATNWYGTMCFMGKPKLINNAGRKEFYGIRTVEFEGLIPGGFKQKKEECCRAEVTLKIEK